MKKLDWLITGVTAVGSPVSAKEEVFGSSFAYFANLGPFCGQGAIL